MRALARAAVSSMLAHTVIASAMSACEWPSVCPGTLPTSQQTYLLNKSTIIMPCNYTGYTDPNTTLGWGIVDFGECTPSVSPCAHVGRLVSFVCFA